MSNAILLERIEPSLVIRFNRPEIRNPLSVSVVVELQEVLAKLAGDIERVVFTGSDGVFASGADLREIAAVSPGDAAEFALRGQRLMQAISELPAHTVAAINGVCFGGALDLALACDNRIAAPQAELSHPGVGLGIITGWGGTQRLPRLVGQAAALEMFLTAGRVSAAEAQRIGLIDMIAHDPVREALRPRGGGAMPKPRN